MKLFINTGGEGRRLYPLTKDIPKPMLPILGRPILERLVEWAKENSITEIIMMSGYKAEVIDEHFKNGEDFGIPIKHSIEPYPLGSGGPIKFAKQYIDDPFFYISGDQICTVNLSQMLEFHKKNNADMTIFVSETDHPEDSDTVRTDENGKITHFLTKFEKKDLRDNLSNRGLCIIEPKILNLMDKEIFNFENEIYPKMLQQNMRLFAYKTDEFMEDMGTPERIKKCEDYLQSKMERVLVTGACGMMGQHLLPLLIRRATYNILGTYYRPTTNIKELPKEVHLKELDVRDYKAVLKIIEEFKPTKILHLAAQSYPTVSLEEPQYTLDTNIGGTTNIFEAIRYLHLQPTILVACSSAEYGFVEEKDLPIKETHPLLPLHPYGVSKVGQDLLAYQYYKNYGIKTIRARIFNTTGPKKVNDACADFTKQAVRIEKGLQENKMYVGNLDTKRAITDVRDMIEAFLLLMEKGEPGEVYNISGEKAYLMRDIVHMVCKEAGITPEIVIDSKLLRPTDEKIIFGDNTKIKTHTGWQQKIPIETTIKDMIDYWRHVL